MSKPSKIGVAVGAAILLLCGSFGAGRYSRPARVEVREHTVTQTQIVEKIVNHDVIQTQVVHDTVKVDNVVTKIVWEKAPDGTVRTVETITDLSKTAEQTSAASQHVTDTRTDVSASSKTETTKSTVTEYARPAWSVAVMPGLDLRGLASDGISGLSTASLVKRGVLGVSVDRRIIGPVFVGAWGNTSGAGGLTVRVEF